MQYTRHYQKNTSGVPWSLANNVPLVHFTSRSKGSTCSPRPYNVPDGNSDDSWINWSSKTIPPTVLLKLKQQNVEIKISLIRAKCTILLGSNCQRADAAWPRVKVDPGSTHALITLVGLHFSLICLNLTCQSGFFVRFHFNYLVHMTGLAALAIMMTKLATDHCQLTTVYYCMGLTLSRLPVFLFFCKVTVSPPIFSVYSCLPVNHFSRYTCIN